MRSKTSAHFWVSNETPSVPEKRVETKPILREVAIYTKPPTSKLSPPHQVQ